MAAQEITEFLREQGYTEDQIRAEFTKAAPPELRDALDERTQERDELREIAVGGIFDKLGLDATEGPGKAVLDTMPTDMALTEDAIGEYARQYGWKPAETDDVDEPVTETKAAEELANAEETVDKLAGSSQPIPPPNDQEALLALNARLTDEDATTDDALKSLKAKSVDYLTNVGGGLIVPSERGS